MWERARARTYALKDWRVAQKTFFAASARATIGLHRSRRARPSPPLLLPSPPPPSLFPLPFARRNAATGGGRSGLGEKMSPTPNMPSNRGRGRRALAWLTPPRARGPGAASRRRSRPFCGGESSSRAGRRTEAPFPVASTLSDPPFPFRGPSFLAAARRPRPFSPSLLRRRPSASTSCRAGRGGPGRRGGGRGCAVTGTCRLARRSARSRRAHTGWRPPRAPRGGR